MIPEQNLPDFCYRLGDSPGRARRRSPIRSGMTRSFAVLRMTGSGISEASPDRRARSGSAPAKPFTRAGSGVSEAQPDSGAGAAAIPAPLLPVTPAPDQGS